MLIRWLAQYLTTFALLSITICIPSRHDRISQHRRGTQRTVSGITSTDEDGHVYLRREIRDLKENQPDQWNLYLLALESLHWSAQDDPYSYYGIASIHGRPYRTWEDAPGLSHKIGTSGYCPHSNELFLGWHRPYIALQEQILHDHMLVIASRAPPEHIDRFTAAANAFRQPYWDWSPGEDTGSVPEFFITPKIALTELDGRDVTMDNPLFSYKFHPLVPDDFDSKWTDINETVRWPNSDEPDEGSQQNEFVRSFEEQSMNLIDGVSLAYRASNFSIFARRLEEPHGWIHGVVGGGWDPKDKGHFRGHFWPLEYSAYEPLFMLHHANVDRLFAIYQAAHPDRWIESSNVGTNGNVFLENGQDVDGDTELLPFRKKSGSFWTTNDCRNTTVLGYAYSETQYWKHDSDDDYHGAAKKIISKKYGGSARKLLKTQHISAGTSLSLGQDNVYTDWMIESEIIGSSFPPTFLVRFSLISDWASDISVDIGTWMRLMSSDRDHVDTSASQSTAERVSQTDVPFRGTTSLTSHLINRVSSGGLKSLNADDVVPYLAERLTWKVYTGDGRLIPETDLNSLTILIVSMSASIPDEEDAPVMFSKESTRHPGVTVGKVGGVTL